MTLSIIITNYNYQEYIKQCIDSCLHQTYKKIEIIVVDDGSTDNSREILLLYEKDVKLIFQKNAGMVEASNVGFNHATGELIMFLDADDYLFKTAIENVIRKWKKGVTVKTHFRLEKRDNNGKLIGLVPNQTKNLSEGDVWSEIVKTGDYKNVPTSGNVYSREVLNKIFPIQDSKIGDENTYLDRFPTDAYLKYRVPYYGYINALQEPLGVYRIHGNNNGVMSSPYFNIKKRKRILYIAKMNSEFANSIINSKEGFIGFYKRIKVIRLIAISYRLDGKDPIFNIKNRFEIYMKLQAMLYKSFGFKIFGFLYNSFLILLLIFLPKNYINKVLNVLFFKK